MIDWLLHLPSEVAYGVASSIAVAVGAWFLRRLGWLGRERSGLPAAEVAADPPDSVVPRLLPRAPRRFVNRETELAVLDELSKRADADGASLVAVVGGLRGVGKSALGRRWAQRHQAQFTGGVLAADFSRRQLPPMQPSDVLDDFLRALGTADIALPVTLADKRRLFERLTADRKLLVLLDGVEQPAQALVTTPTGAGSLAVVSSAVRLEELVREGAEPIILEPLEDKSATELLASFVGQARLDDEKEATRSIVAACAGLPIALCVCGARLATRPGRPVAWLADQLKQPGRTLRVLSPPGQFDVGAVFDAAYRDLTDDAAKIYRRLGLHSGPDFTAAVTAAVGRVSLDRAAALLDELEDAYLLQPETDGRFSAHQLVREHMALRVAEDETASSREQSVRRLVDWYTAAAQAADHAVVDERLRYARARTSAANVPYLSTPREAFAWFAAESENVLSAQQAALEREWYEQVWQIAEALWPLCASHKRFNDWKQSHEAAIIASIALSDRWLAGRMRSQLARAYAELDQPGLAKAEIELALSDAEAAHDPRLLASVMEFAGVCQLRAGDLATALASFLAARERFRACGMERGVALQDYYIGWCLVEGNDDAAALEPLARAEALMRDLGDEINVGRALLRRGVALWHLHRIDEARDVLTSAIEVLSGADVQFEQAEAYEKLAEIARAGNDAEAVQQSLRRAYGLYQELGHPRAEVLIAALEGESG